MTLLHDLLKDWQMQPNVQLQCPNFYNFPFFLNTKFGEGNLLGVKALSPRAHPSETIAPLEVGYLYLQIEKSLEKLEVASQALNSTHEINEKSNEKLKEERKRLEQIVPQLNAFLTPTNKDKIQQALLARINARNNQ